MVIWPDPRLFGHGGSNIESLIALSLYLQDRSSLLSRIKLISPIAAVPTPYTLGYVYFLSYITPRRTAAAAAAAANCRADLLYTRR